MTPLLLALVVYPLLEEYVFRRQGMTLAARWRPGWPPLAVNAVVSAAFAMAHAFAWPLPHAAAVFVPSLVLGVVFQRTRRWEACAVLHAAMNALWLALPPSLTSILAPSVAVATAS
jgi:membrane protease YdiL (CAAX protease family)